MREFDKCVYLHKDKDDIVRYVGHGNKDRPFEVSKTKRSKKWYSVFEDYKPTVEIVADNLSYDAAIELEIALIELYKDTVVNINPVVAPADMDFDWFDAWFYIDSTSPSGLRWKAQRPRSKMYAGDQAGSLLTKETGKQYWQIKVGKKVYKVHRVVYLLANGEIDPSLVIDHIDGNGLNNKLENLRLVPHFVNGMNKRGNQGREFPKNIRKTRRNLYGAFEFKTRIYNFKARIDDFDSIDSAVEYLVNEIETTRESLYRESAFG